MWHKPLKIVGLVAARNEAGVIDQVLYALALYTDTIIFLDDASTGPCCITPNQVVEDSCQLTLMQAPPPSNLVESPDSP